MTRMFSHILPTGQDKATRLAGDDILPDFTTVIDSAFNLKATPQEIYPWFLQLGKQRAGWYFPRKVEWFTPKKRRGLRIIEPQLQHLSIGQRIPDWGGKDGYLQVAILEPNKAIVYRSERGKLKMSWAITFWPQSQDTTRVIIRLRLRSAGSGRLMKLGEIVDRLTIAGLQAGLKERLTKSVI